MPKAIDIAGRKFGKLTALEPVSGPIRKWKCKCDCGEIVYVKTGALRAGYNKTCGKKQCSSLKNISKALRHVVGKSFGKLLALRIDENRKKRSDGRYSTLVVFQCDCGNERSFLPYKVRSGEIMSCGQCSLMRSDKIKEQLSSDEALFFQVISEYRSNAKKRNLEFALTNEQCISLLSDNCFYCGSKPSRQKTDKCKLGRVLIVNGIDRKDSSKGYLYNNTVSCCIVCNKMKNSTSYKEFVYRIQLMYQNLKMRGVL